MSITNRVSQEIREGINININNYDWGLYVDKPVFGLWGWFLG